MKNVFLTKSPYHHCAVPESIHTPPQGLEFRGGGGFCKAKNLKKCMKFNWRVVGDLRKKSLPWGRYGYFLELHIPRPYPW